MGARLTGSQKVRGSNPLISTKLETNDVTRAIRIGLALVCFISLPPTINFDGDIGCDVNA